MKNSVMKKNLGTLICCVVAILFCFLFICTSSELPSDTKKLPLLVAWVTVFFSVFQGILCAVAMGKASKEEKAEKDTNSAENSEKKSKGFHALPMPAKMWIMVGLMLLTILLWYLVGYVPACILIAAIMMYLMGERRIWLILLVSAIVACALYFGFHSLLGVPIHNGILFGGQW